MPFCYIAHEASVVHARKTFLNDHDRSEFGFANDDSIFARGSADKRPSLLRKWLGDETVSVVEVDESAPIAEKQAAAVLFPEAEIDLISTYRLEAGAENEPPSPKP